jgi:SAM-dependent methyltransferase
MTSPSTPRVKPRREASAQAYDRQFSSDPQTERHYSETIYYPLHRRACGVLRTKPGRLVLEVGCGAGAFAHCATDSLSVTYSGFDFSEAAVSRARERTGRSECFFVADARCADSYHQPYDTIVSLEVLEHIERDIEVVENWRSGCFCVCSVPNFDYETHVRWFNNEREIVDRYGGLISIENIERVACPMIQGRGLRAYLRQLRWSRNNPRRLLGLLGYRSFDYFAGWFLFYGTRRGS